MAGTNLMACVEQLIGDINGNRVDNPRKNVMVLHEVVKYASEHFNGDNRSIRMVVNTVLESTGFCRDERDLICGELYARGIMVKKTYAGNPMEKLRKKIAAQQGK